MSWKQAEKIVTTITENKRISRVQSQELLRRLEKIHGIELNPLLVTVFAATTDFSKQDIPANITELFKKFTELMLGRWDEEKGLKYQYQAPLKDFVLTKIAFHVHRHRKTSILRSEAEEIARVELQTRGHEAAVEQMLSEIFDRSGLFRISGSEIEFRHHLLQEFLLAVEYSRQNI
jgi:predicted NACHT family NTPase